MKECIGEMRRRHQKEIDKLREDCPHPRKTEWMDYQPILGHTMGQVRCCVFCGQILQKRGITFDCEVEK
jgi:hypothetical protein